ncbi:MAG: EamA family transporter [Bacteroidales bacterium]|nr:EamA family transporter [Bacteroidales bacterium]MBN2820693.1 EamA family transporter [Bacteroidales bacterium]
MQYIAALISIILGAVAQYLFKIGVTTVSNNSRGVAQVIKYGIINPHLLSGMICYGFSFILWFYVLSKMELSKAYPLVSLGYIFTLFLGYLFLNEAITYTKIIGISLIVIGVVVLSQ